MAGNGNNGGGASHLDWLRARHAALTEDRTMDLDVPGYQGRLVVRYGRVPWSAIAKAQDLIAKPGRDGEGSLLAQIDFLVAACREVLVRDEAGDLQPLDPEAATPVRFDSALATLLGSETTTARTTVRWLFANDAAIAIQAGEVLSWTAATDDDVSSEFMGESAPVVK